MSKRSLVNLTDAGVVAISRIDAAQGRHLLFETLTPGRMLCLSMAQTSSLDPFFAVRPSGEVAQGFAAEALVT